MVENICPLCHLTAETVEHLFFHCPVAVFCWSQAGVEISSSVLTSLSNSCKALIDGVDMHRKCHCLCVMWGIWKVRNKYVFDADHPVEVQKILATALKLGKDYGQLHMTPSPNIIRPTVHWHPPEMGWYKVNTDASLISDGGRQVGALVHNFRGHYVASAICRFPYISHPTLLEAYGYRIRLELACSLRLSQVVMESDCQ